eukprot:6466524-Amphidinium_carterae.4
MPPHWLLVSVVRCSVSWHDMTWHWHVLLGLSTRLCALDLPERKVYVELPHCLVGVKNVSN